MPGNYFDQFDGPPQSGGIITLPPSPQQQRQEARQSQNDAIENVLKQQRIAEWKATHNPDGSPSDGADALDEQTKAFYAQQILAGGQMPSLGMGKAAAAARQEIMKEVARQAGASGLSGADLARQVTHYKAGSAQIANLEKQLGTIGVNEQTALANGQQYLDRSAELPAQTGVPILNSIVQGAQRNLPIPGHDTIAAADAALNTFLNEYGKVVSGSPNGAGTLSDSARHEAQATMRGNYAQSQKQAAFDQMKRDMANRIMAMHQGINNAYTSLTQKPGYVIPDSTASLDIGGANNQNGTDHRGNIVAGGFGVNGGGTPPPMSGGPPGGPPGGGPGPGSVWNQTYLSHGGGPVAAGNMATQRQGSIPPGMQSEYDAYMASHAQNLDPQDYVQFRSGLDQKYGFNPDPESYRQFAVHAAQVAKQGGTINTTIPGPTIQMSPLEQQRNNLVDNPEAAAMVGAGDAATLGIPSLLLGDRMKALNAAHPTAMTLGQIAGSIAATKGTASLGAAAAKKLAPFLLGGGEGAAMARGLANDAVYGTVTGSNQGMDPTTAALSSVVGSGLGQLGGKALGSAVGGIAMSDAARSLRDKGVRLTTGQMFGGLGKSLEDAAISLPFAGDMINARRLEGLRDFNKVMFNKAGEPINATVGNLGEQGVNDLLQSTSNAYDASTAGVSVPLDDQFFTDLRATEARARTLPPDLRDKFLLAMDNRLQPIMNGARVPPANMVGALPERGVVPANIGADGKIYVGDPGSSHFHVTEKYPDVRFGGETGFVSPDGRYLNREEALAYVNSNGNAIRPSDNMNGQLDALDYREQARVRPSVANAPVLTGEGYQQAFRGLKGYRAEMTKPGFEQDYRDALSLGMDALRNQMNRGGGAQVVEGLANADQAYRGAKTLQNAVQAAKNGTGSGEIQVFTPAQANTASTQAANRYGGGRQFADTIDAGQTVLPSRIPDSGTARRLMMARGLLGAGILGAGAGSGYASGDATGGAVDSAALLGLLALGGTRTGQTAINKLLFDRPDAFTQAASLIRKNKGLFGSAAIPLALESSK